MKGEIITLLEGITEVSGQLYKIIEFAIFKNLMLVLTTQAYYGHTG